MTVLKRIYDKPSKSDGLREVVAARDEKHDNAFVLKEYIEHLGGYKGEKI